MRYLMMACMLLCSPNLLAGQDITSCATIKNATERLACYDRIARGEQPQRTPQQTPAAGVADTPVEPENAGAATASQTTEESTTEIPEQPSRSVDEQAFVRKFGKFGADVSEGDSIRSTIEKVHRNNLHLYVMTLNNGQVWMQREPGNRPIHASQPVTITRKHWSYGMMLQDQNFEVTVKRMK